MPLRGLSPRDNSGAARFLRVAFQLLVEAKGHDVNSACLPACIYVHLLSVLSPLPPT